VFTFIFIRTVNDTIGGRILLTLQAEFYYTYFFPPFFLVVQYAIVITYVVDASGALSIWIYLYNTMEVARVGHLKKIHKF
jgi:hypothetical protein